MCGARWPRCRRVCLGRQAHARRPTDGEHLAGRLSEREPEARWLRAHLAGRGVSAQRLRDLRHDRQRLGVDPGLVLRGARGRRAEALLRSAESAGRGGIGELRPGAAGNPNTAQSPEGRLAPLRAELLLEVPASGAARAAGRHVHEPRRLSPREPRAGAMNAAKLIGIGIQLSIMLMVFGIGLSAGAAQVRPAVKDAGLLARSLLGMYIVVPLVAVFVALNFDLNRGVLLALLLLALSPVPPIMPGKQVRAGGSPGYVLGLLGVASLAAIIVVPVGARLIGLIFGRDIRVPFGVTTEVVALSVLLPVIAGLVVARLAPGFATKATKPSSIGAAILLAVVCLPVLWMARHALARLTGNFTLLAIVLVSLTGLAVGHLLGGPHPGNRAALALAPATRHPGVALGVLKIIAPGDKEAEVAVVLYLLVSIVATFPYFLWRKRARAAQPAN